MTNKTIKFFISSTFKDFLKERNTLQNFVFPRLKKICQKKGFYFQPVDLRWGVTEESSEDNKTMEYCLNEVKRCSTDPKPNLLILLGQRYGWGPLPSYIMPNIFSNIILEEIKNSNFLEEDFPRAKQKWENEILEEKDKKKKESLEKEFEKANNYKFKNTSIKKLLKEWYIQDTNDTQQKYFLKDKKETPSLIWRFIEKILKKAILDIDETKTSLELYKQFHTSATEQEIRFALEQQYKSNSTNTIVYSRKFKDGSKDKDLIEDSSDAQAKLEKLNQYLDDKKDELTFIKNTNIDIDCYNKVIKECEEYAELSEDLKYFCIKVLREFGRNILKEIKTQELFLTFLLKIYFVQIIQLLKMNHVFHYIGMMR